jgi:hypothetical protein
MIVKAVEDVTTDFDITDALSDYLDLLRDFSGCIENIQNDCNGCLVKEDKPPEDVLQELKDMYNTNRLIDLVWKTSRVEKVCKALETVAWQVKYLKDSINKITCVKNEQYQTRNRKLQQSVKNGGGLFGNSQRKRHK